MSFNPTKREPKVHLDRWVIVADDIRSSDAWVRKNLLFHRGIGKSAYLVSPRFDPTDFFHIYIIYASDQLYGLNYYEVVDIRTRKTIEQDGVLLENSLTKALAKNLVRRRPQNVLQSPHPLTPEKDNDNINLRRYWVSPDPFVHQELDDQCGPTDGPEWLAPEKRLR